MVLITRPKMNEFISSALAHRVLELEFQEESESQNKHQLCIKAHNTKHQAFRILIKKKGGGGLGVCLGGSDAADSRQQTSRNMLKRLSLL